MVHGNFSHMVSVDIIKSKSDLYQVDFSWIISKQKNWMFCCIQSEHLINYKIMYNRFTFFIYHNLSSIWCLLLLWWCFFVGISSRGISFYLFSWHINTYGNRSLQSAYISAIHCIIYNGYCYNNPSHGFYTNTLTIHYKVLLYYKHIINFCLPLLCMASRLCTVDGAPETWLISFVWTLNTSLSS